MPERSSSGTVIRGTDADRLLTKLGVGEGIPPGTQALVAQELVELLSSIADEARLVVAAPPLPPGAVGMQVMRTRVYIRLNEVKSSRIAVLCTLMAAALTHSTATSAASAAVAALISNIKRLSDDQVEMLARMRRLSEGDVYTRWLEEGDILSTWPIDEEEKARRILADLASMGVLQQGAGMWRASL